MRTLTLTLLLAVAVSHERARGQQAKKDGTEATGASLRLNLSIDDMRPAKVKVEIQTGELTPKVLKKLEDARPGSSELGLSDLADGDYLVFFTSPGYAAQWQSLTVKQGKGEPSEMKVNLFRKRYVVLRYVFNTSGGREFSGKSIKEGRAAVAHWGSLPYFQQDWQIWQKAPDGDMFGDTPFLDFHRFSNGFGFAKVPDGVAFDDLKETPANTQYNCKSTKAEKGLTLFCRVEADRKEGLGYGKVVVEDVTETPPAGVKRIELP